MLNHRTLGRWTTLTAVVLAAWSGAVRADTFPAGSLIIPTSASYQDPCGMVSAYGLVYTVLRANDGLRAHPESAKGAWTAPITIHWVYNPAKSSPNRCVPTNLDVVYNGGSQWKDSSGNTAGQSSAIWNDGCDFNITNTGGVPVALISTTSTTTDYSTWRTYATNDTNGQAL
ncbi:MAG: hypothetical protein JST92_01870, partial [Deltaproteobacteria bacterium]|nr:hypothetical protein [Deltaproteobacteria bacterium]